MAVGPEQFLAVVREPLQAGDAEALAGEIRLRWTPGELVPLLEVTNVDARRSAALVLGLIGDSAVAGPLAKALHDEDEQVHQMAEHALWSIWFRGCGCEAIEPFRHATELLAEEQYDEAVRAFGVAIAKCPEFAEAYNQRAMAHFFAGRYERSAEDCRWTMKRMPVHFGAAAGLGHSLCHLGDMDGALSAYRKALAINPHMPGIRSAIERIEAKLSKTQKPAAVPAQRLSRN